VLRAASRHNPYKETNGISGHCAVYWGRHPRALHFVGCPALLVLRSACWTGTAFHRQGQGHSEREERVLALKSESLHSRFALWEGKIPAWDSVNSSSGFVYPNTALPSELCYSDRLLRVFHWYYKQALSTKEHDLGVSGENRHTFTMTFHSSNTFPFSHKWFSWDAPKIPAVFHEIVFWKFLSKYLSQFKNK